jgi:hypothetical protein
VRGSFQLLEKFADIVEAQPRLETAEVSRLHLERGRRPVSTALETGSKRFVHDLFESAACASRLGTELRFNIVIECQSSAHELMLGTKHHDVKRDGGDSFR